MSIDSKSAFKLCSDDSVENLKLNIISRLPGTTLWAPVPELILEIWKLVGSKISFPLSHFLFFSFVIKSLDKNIGLITQFGNMAMCYADLLKLELLHKRNMIDCAIYILLTKNDKRAKKDNYAQFEKLCKHLKLYDEVVHTPLLLIGLENGDRNEFRF